MLCLPAGGSLLPCKRRSSAAVLPQTTHPATALACRPAGSLLKSAECSWQDMRYRSKLKQQPCSMAHGRWKQREQEGTLHPSAAPGLSHTLHRRLRARRTSRTTDCSLFQASTVICTAAAAAQPRWQTRIYSARSSVFPPAHTCLTQVGRGLDVCACALPCATHLWAPQRTLVVDVDSIMPLAAGEEGALHLAQLATIGIGTAPAKGTQLRRQRSSSKRLAVLCCSSCWSVRHAV